jgi:hypothetical protein
MPARNYDDLGEEEKREKEGEYIESSQSVC